MADNASPEPPAPGSATPAQSQVSAPPMPPPDHGDEEFRGGLVDDDDDEEEGDGAPADAGDGEA